MLKEKLKLLKVKIRKWDEEKFKGIERKIEKLSEKFRVFHEKLEHGDLLAKEREARGENWTDLRKLLDVKDQIHVQQARSK